MLLALAAASRAQTLCTAADIIAADPTNCPNTSAPCTIAKTLQIGDGCTLDFGTRAVIISSTGILDINSSNVTLNAGSLTIAPGATGGFIDGRGNRPSPGDQGGMITINTTGDVDIQRNSVSGANGRIDVSGNAAAGSIAINADGKINVAGHLEANQLPNQADASGGTIQLNAGTDISMPKNGEISATGGNMAGGGEIDLSADGQLMLNDQITASGSCGGTVMIAAGTTVNLQGISVNATGDAALGGDIQVEGGLAATRAADGAINLLGLLSAQGGPPLTGGGGCGGSVTVTADFGDIVVAGGIQAEGTAGTVGEALDGGGGMISLTSQGSTIIQSNATVSARSNGFTGCGGMVCLEPNLAANVQGKIDASGGGMGGCVEFCAGTDVTLGALVPILDVSGSGPGGAGGQADIGGSGNRQGTIDILGTVDATGALGNAVNPPGDGGNTSFTACTITVEAGGAVLARAPGDGGENDFVANEQINIFGKVDAHSTGSGVSGVNMLTYPSRNPPVLTGSILPAVGGVIVAVTPVSPGTGYVVGDVLTIAGGTGGQATVTAVTMNTITSVAVAAGGTKYRVGDVLTIATGTGGKVSVASVDAAGAVLSAFVISGGSGYTTGTPLAASGGHGTGCTINVTATVSTGVTALSVKSGGTGYSAGTGAGTPTSGGHGTGATLALTIGTELIPVDTCAGSINPTCLIPCPKCGDGIVEFPEECDNGTGQSCQPASPGSATNCSAFCEFENCNDGHECTLDACDPALGCTNIPPAAPCTEPPTSTPTITATPTMTPTPSLSATPTNTQTPANTQTPTITQAPTFSPTTTSIPNDTPTRTATSTQTPTLTSTSLPSATLTPSPTPAAPADANCDGRITAADVPAVVRRLGSTPVCGTDANLDGKVDAADITLTIAKIFGS